MSKFSGKCDKSFAKLNVRRFTFMTLKEKLLSTTLFNDNEYFNLYLKLIEANYNTKRQTFKTQKHHIIPVIAFKLFNQKGVNDKDNLVNLLYKDHILAHYYLALCSKDFEFKYKMICAINFILGRAVQVKNLNVKDLKTFILELDKYQELYEQSKIYFANKIKGTHHTISEETKQKIGRANKGRVYVNKDGIVRSLYSDEVEVFLVNGWVFGNPGCIKRNLHKGNTIVNKDNIEKSIKKEELQEYLDNGWRQGLTEAHKLATKNGTQAYYDALTDEEKIKKCATRLGQHWQMSDEQKEKIRVANTGKKQSANQRLKNSINKKETIWMTNGEKDIMIKKELEQEYISQGFYRGRSKNRKENVKEGDFYE